MQVTIEVKSTGKNEFTVILQQGNTAVQLYQGGSLSRARNRANLCQQAVAACGVSCKLTGLVKEEKAEEPKAEKKAKKAKKEPAAAKAA